MDRAGFEDWLRGYFDAWVSNDPVDVGALFTEDAIYWVGPFREPWVGRDQIVDRWTSGQQEDVRAAFDVIAVEGRRGSRTRTSPPEPATGARRNGTGS
jgi:hypothetical protein